jgi:pimeloyl-ACP methyl ester carboxylesterase
MGGMIAQELALRSPGHVGRLVLLATRPPTPEYSPPASSVTAQLLGPAEGQDLAAFLRQHWAAIAGPGFDAAHPELVDDMVRGVVARPTPRFAVLDQARAIAGWHGAGRLRRLAVDTTVVHGSDDPLIPVRNGMRLAQLIPGARYVELEGVGHLVPYEATDRVAELIEVPR